MATENIKKAASEVLDALGGKDNVSSAINCMTRLRVTVKDHDLVDFEKLKTTELSKGVNESNGQIQIIYGTGLVNKVASEFTKIVDLDEESQKYSDQNKSNFQKIIGFFGDVFVPILPAIIAAGMLLGIRNFLVSAGIVEADTGWYSYLAILSDTAFTFLPALVAWSTMRKLGGTQVLGIVIGLMLVSPLLPSAAAVARGQADAIEVGIFGISYGLTSYAGRVLPAMLVTVFAAYLERLCRRYIPNVLDIVLTPLIVTSVSLFVGFFILGPSALFIENIIVNIYSAIIFIPFGIGGFIISFTQQFIVITGLHHALWIIDFGLLEQYGENAMQPLRSASVMGQTGAVAALALFASQKQLRTNSSASFISGMFGITEPAIYGGTLLYPIIFLCGAIGAGLGGMFASIINLAPNGVGTNGLPAYFFYSDLMGVLQFTLVLLISGLSAFILAAIAIRYKKI